MGLGEQSCSCGEFGSVGSFKVIDRKSTKLPCCLPFRGTTVHTVKFIPYLFPLEDVCVSACSVAQSCLTLCDPMDCSPPGSSVHGIFQARIPKQVATTSSRVSSRIRDQICVSWVSCIGRWILYHYATWEAPLRAIVSQTVFCWENRRNIFHIQISE